MIEGVISRGNDALAPLFEYLAENGVKLEAWREFFKPEPYFEWFDENGLDMQSYVKGRDFNKPLPWDFIDTGIDRSFLMDEMMKAEHGEMTVDCYSGCASCGIDCQSRVRALFPFSLSGGSHSEGQGSGVSEGRGTWDVASGTKDKGQENSEIKNPQSAISKKFTFRYGKYGDARYIGHIDTMNILLRALRASGVSIKMHGKYHPMPKIALTDALPVGIESTCELMEVETDEHLVLDGRVLKEMNMILPRGMKVFEVVECSLKDMVKEYAYILVSEEDTGSEELKRWRNGSRNRFYLWKGKGIKLLWQKGIFKRIVKVEDKKVYGL